MAAKKGKTNIQRPGSTGRSIPARVKILLAAVAGGRCELAGCNHYLFNHPLTLRGGNFSEQAHIYPFGQSGPRAEDGTAPSDIHSVENLMLLCQACHKLIDDNSSSYSRTVLQQYKKEHEERIRHVTGLGPDMKTTVVQLRARIGGQAVDIPASEIYEAVAPRYPVDERGHLIDITALDDGLNDAYWDVAVQQISTDVARIYDQGMSVQSTRHISLFALAPIPLLVHLGRNLSNKVAVDFYQRHRAGSPWVWKTDGQPARFIWKLIRSGQDMTRIALVIAVSGRVRADDLPAALDDRFFVYELSVSDPEPGLDVLRQRTDLDRFRLEYRALMSHIRATHPANELHLFPAMPAPIAVACGYDLLPKVDPSLVVYDNLKGFGGFIRRLKVNNHD